MPVHVQTTSGARVHDRRRRLGIVLAVAAMVVAILPAAAIAQDDPDPREGLGAGLYDAESAISGLEHLDSFQKQEGTLTNFVTDLAFQDDYVFVGNYNGLQVFDASDPTDLTLTTEVLCPGSQNDVSVYGNLLFQSVEATSARIDCGTQGNSGDTAGETRFRGIRIYDISDPEVPALVGGVQTCRGSHTHTVVEDLNDPDNVYVYVSGTGSTRSATELPECNNGGADTTQPSRWRIEVVKVPLAAPATAEIVNHSYLFTNDEGAVNGLNFRTDACHDITAYPEIGLAAGACEGNGLLVDISDPEDPTRVDFVADTVNFAYWHSATFNNDGTKVVFTDELGGGGGARCRSTDPYERGANGIYDITQTDDGPKMEFRSYYKMPAVQTSQENCVAHNGSLIPIPGRDIMVQAWYQGGTSIFDFTDSAAPQEIAFFDRGPNSAASLVLGGFWSTYWYNGLIYGSEIGRGLDVFALAETEHISDAEIAAAQEITTTETNVQGQTAYAWGPSFNVIEAFGDQLGRTGDARDAKVQTRVEDFLAGAQAAETRAELLAAGRYAEYIAENVDSATDRGLIEALTLMAAELRSQARPAS